MQPIQVEERRVQSFDGTSVAYHTVGRGRPILLCNGLGGSFMAWTHQIAHFRDDYRFISWDYRGLYQSGPPRDPAALRVEDHARDGLAVLEAEGVAKTAIVGWSMGVQVALEIFRRAPEKVACLVLLNGVAGEPWNTVMNFRMMSRVLPPVLRALGSASWLTEGVTRRISTMPEAVQWAKRLGLASSTLDEDVFAQLAQSFRYLDMRTYMRVLELLGEHDAHDVLAEVDVPTLMIAGDRDLFTPKAAAKRIVSAIAGAELLVVPGGTHYVAVEYPELVNLRIEKFFRERGYEPGGAAP
jgi:pimeloyl-ACP methyl ester carboxylesterase